MGSTTAICYTEATNVDETNGGRGWEKKARLEMPSLWASRNERQKRQQHSRSFGGSTADAGRPKPSIYMGGAEGWVGR